MKERVDLRLSTQSEQNIVPPPVSLFMRMMGEMNRGLFSPTPVWLFQLTVPTIFQGKRRQLGKEKKVCVVCVCVHTWHPCVHMGP